MIPIDDKCGVFISKLIVLTKEGKLVWDYLDSKKNLYENLSLSPYSGKSIESINNALENKQGFDTSNSFYTTINYNYIVIYIKSPTKKEENFLEKLKILLVPRTFKSVEEIECQSEIVRLHTIIKSKFPSPDNIISDIINYEKKTD